MRALLELDPQPGKVSWMIPLARAMTAGGIQAAFARLEEIKHNPDFFMDPYDLVTLAHQLLSVKKYDLASDVLKLNLHAFPDHRGSSALLESVAAQKDG
jgi:hypothetical protein